MKKGYAITITAREQAKLLREELPGKLENNQVCGSTICTLMSPGTELAWNYQSDQVSVPGYAAVFKVEKVGKEVEDIVPGDTVFAMGGHRSFQQFNATDVVKVPKGLAPKVAVLVRLMGVTMSTLTTTTARPGDQVLVTGLGPVGHLGALLFQHNGYEVTGVDPDKQRCQWLKDNGIKRSFRKVPIDELQDQVALGLECSGHEQAILDACRVVKKRGEVVLTGVPWQRKTDLSMHELVYEIFHRYVVLRSGWEWELPHHDTPFKTRSLFANYAAGLKWLKDGVVPNAKKVCEIISPKSAQEAYQNQLHHRTKGLFTIFDWQKL